MYVPISDSYNLVYVCAYYTTCMIVYYILLILRIILDVAHGTH